MKFARFFALLSAVAIVVYAGILQTAEPDKSANDAPAQTPDATETGQKSEERLVPLNPEGTVLIDKPGKRLLLKTEVVLREGLLEMLCCPKQTKEHESILSVDSQAYTIHAGLLAIGAKPGKPVRFMPEFQPPTGQTIDIFLNWKDEKGRPARAPAQSWIRYNIHRYYVQKFEQRPAGLKIPEGSDLRYDDKHNELIWYGPMNAKMRDDALLLSADSKYQAAIKSFFDQGKSRPMEGHWVFAGSGFFTDPESGEKYYEAEGGDLICVSNFPSALLDVSVKSSASGQQLLFEAFTENLPPVGTEVTVELIPVAEKPKEKE